MSITKSYSISYNVIFRWSTQAAGTMNEIIYMKLIPMRCPLGKAMDFEAV